MVVKKENKRINVTLSKKIHDLLKGEAEYEGRSVGNMAAKIIKDYYRNKGKIK